MVAISPPVVKYHARSAQCLEQFAIQAIGSKSPVKTLAVAVLPRSSGIDVKAPDPVILQPLLDHIGDELRAIVTPDIRGRPVLGDGLLKNCQHIGCFNRFS